MLGQISINWQIDPVTVGTVLLSVAGLLWQVAAWKAQVNEKLALMNASIDHLDEDLGRISPEELAVLKRDIQLLWKFQLRRGYRELMGRPDLLEDESG